jgi:hypothetical protein
MALNKTTTNNNVTMQTMWQHQIYYYKVLSIMAILSQKCGQVLKGSTLTGFDAYLLWYIIKKINGDALALQVRCAIV